MNTVELEDGMKAVLQCLALYCNADLVVKYAEFTQENVRRKTGMGERPVARAFARLERTRLLVRIDSPYPGERVKYWQLPSEDQLATYIPS